MRKQVEKTIVELLLFASSVAEGQTVVHSKLIILLDILEYGGLSKDGVAFLNRLHLDSKHPAILQANSLMQLQSPALGELLDNLKLPSDYYLAHNYSIQ